MPAACNKTHVNAREEARQRRRRLPAAFPPTAGPVYGLARTWLVAFPSARRSVA